MCRRSGEGVRVIRPEKTKNYLHNSHVPKPGYRPVWVIAAGSLLLVFAKLVEDLLCQELGVFDAVVGDYIRSFASSSLTSSAVVITQAGSAAAEIFLMILVGWYLMYRLKNKWEAIVLCGSLAGGWLLNTLLKNIFQRTRPDVLHLIEVGGYSFPSGHAMISTAFYGMLGYLLWLNLRERAKPAWPVAVITPCLIFFIGVSRVYLGVHFPSDVIAGFAAGGVWLAACITGLDLLRKYKSQDPG